MRFIISVFGVIAMGLSLSSHATNPNSLSDITGNVDQFGVIYPGIFCKTRTNDENTVRNLAHGVYNRDSTPLVALNCGVPAPYPWAADTFSDNTRVDGNINVVFVRDPGVSDTLFSTAFCIIAASNEFTDTATPSVNDGTNAITLGRVEPETPFANFNMDVAGVDTAGVSYPAPASVGPFVFFSAFCRLPKGVRIQAIELSPHSIGVH